jgi:hypothetical protein
MVSDPEWLRARAARYREKAVELRERAGLPEAAIVSADLLKLAQEYEDMARQLDGIGHHFPRDRSGRPT